jgi:hypothetical protein
MGGIEINNLNNKFIVGFGTSNITHIVNLKHKKPTKNQKGGNMFILLIIGIIRL